MPSAKSSLCLQHTLVFYYFYSIGYNNFQAIILNKGQTQGGDILK